MGFKHKNRPGDIFGTTRSGFLWFQLYSVEAWEDNTGLKLFAYLCNGHKCFTHLLEVMFLTCLNEFAFIKFVFDMLRTLPKLFIGRCGFTSVLFKV